MLLQASNLLSKFWIFRIVVLIFQTFTKMFQPKKMLIWIFMGHILLYLEVFSQLKILIPHKLLYCSRTPTQILSWNQKEKKTYQMCIKAWWNIEDFIACRSLFTRMYRVLKAQVDNHLPKIYLKIKDILMLYFQANHPFKMIMKTNLEI